MHRRTLLENAALAAASAPLRSQTAQERLRVGVVGVGLRGNFLAGTVTKLAESGEPVEIGAVCDIYQPRLERAEVKYKAKGYRNTSDMLQQAGLDAVIIATPDRHHLYNLREALRAGKDVYVEKPLCHWAQFDLLKEVVHEARKLNRIVQVGSQYLADPVWEQGRELVRSGAIGKPVHVQIPNFRNTDAGERAMMTIDDPNAKDGVGVDWAKFQADAPARAFDVIRMFQWRSFIEYSGGPLTDVGVHEMCAAYRMLDPGFPSKAVATGGRFHWNHGRTAPDTMDVLIQYPQGFSVAIIENFVNDHFPVEKVIRGSEGTARLTPDALQIYPLHRVPYGTRAPAVKLEPSRVLPTLRGKAIAEAGANPPIIPDATMVHIKDFLDSVRSRRQPRFDLELGYRVHVPLCMAMRSHFENKVALFDASTEQIRMS